MHLHLYLILVSTRIPVLAASLHVLGALASTDGEVGEGSGSGKMIENEQAGPRTTEFPPITSLYKF